jgi:hypothetical protein
MELHLEDVGQARPSVLEDRIQRARRHRIAQLCLDISEQLAALAHELDPDLPDDPQRGRNGK